MVETWVWWLSVPVCMAGAGLGLHVASRRKGTDCQTRVECLAAWVLWSFAAFVLNSILNILWQSHGLSFYHVEDFVVSFVYAYLMAEVKIFRQKQDARSEGEPD